MSVLNRLLFNREQTVVNFLKALASKISILIYVILLLEFSDKPNPWSRVLPENPICSQLVKKSPALCGNLGFVTLSAKAGHLSVS